VRATTTDVACAAFALLFLIFAETAHVGQLHFKNIDLDELIRRSQYTVVAVPDDPPTVEERVTLQARGKNVPPYVRIVRRYRVRESLRGGLAPGAAIAVAPADDALHERLHRDYHASGLSRHVAVDRYEPQATHAAAEPRILFLTDRGERYAYVVDGAAEGLAMRGEIVRRLNHDAVPDRLAFEFGTVRVAKQGDEITLLAYPQWNDAQRPPPPDFDTGQRTLRLPPDRLARVWQAVRGLDLARYARVTDAGFTPTPPDVQHTERLKVVINGDTRVEWSRGYQMLVPELRAPLAALERELREWLAAQPPPDPAKFRHFILRDVEGLNGGQNVYLADDGTVIVQKVAPAQGDQGLTEQRYRWRLAAAELMAIRQALVRYSPVGMRLPRRPGMPGELWVELIWEGENGERIVVAKWASDPQVDFDALYSLLLRYARQADLHKPVWTGGYDPGWRPDGVFGLH
jgi:hypothetical protein